MIVRYRLDSDNDNDVILIVSYSPDYDNNNDVIIIVSYSLDTAISSSRAI